MKAWFKNNKTNLIIFVIYAIFTLTLVFFHENWRDESQAWLLARDCNIIELVRSNEV